MQPDATVLKLPSGFTPLSSLPGVEGGDCRYEDERGVRGLMSAGVSDGLRWLRIDEWESARPGQGNARKALSGFREHFDVIVVNGVGCMEDGVPDETVAYWMRQHGEGLVDELLLDDGSRVDMGPPGRLTLVRGHQGSGKTTHAKSLVCQRPGLRHFEQDQFLERDGTYAYDPVRHAAAKQWCLKAAALALSNGHDVVVSNTFTTLAELEPYLALEKSGLEVVEMFHEFENTHGVPQEVVEAKKAQFEPFDGALQIGKPTSTGPRPPGGMR